MPANGRVYHKLGRDILRRLQPRTHAEFDDAFKRAVAHTPGLFVGAHFHDAASDLRREIHEPRPTTAARFEYALAVESLYLQCQRGVAVPGWEDDHANRSLIGGPAAESGAADTAYTGDAAHVFLDPNKRQARDR